MLLNVKIDILVEVGVLGVSFIPEGAKLGDDDTPSGHNLLATQKNRAQGPVHLLPILGSAELLHVAPPF